jgi:hypothetical protein
VSEQAKEPTRIQKIIGAIVIKAYQLKQKIKPAKPAPPAAPQPEAETESTNP